MAKRSERGAAGSAMRRNSSTHGPVALTTHVASTASAGAAEHVGALGAA